MTLSVPDAAERDGLADVVARVVRLDPMVAVRLRAEPGRVAMWAPTPFDVLVTAAVGGTVDPADITVVGSDLLAALTVVAAPVLELGRPVDDRWRGAVPEGDGWRVTGEIPAVDAEALAAEGIAAARAGDPSGAPSDALLDRVAVEVADLRVPMRCLLALAGMGWPEGGDPVEVALSGDGAWMRLAVGGGAIVRHRRPRLSWA